jgi:hypothetical protein
MFRHLLTARAALGLVLAIGVGSLACRLDESRPSAAPSAATRVTIGEIEWYVDYDAAVEVAREQDKALWVHFGENPG